MNEMRPFFSIFFFTGCQEKNMCDPFIKSNQSRFYEWVAVYFCLGNERKTPGMIPAWGTRQVRKDWVYTKERRASGSLRSKVGLLMLVETPRKEHSTGKAKEEKGSEEQWRQQRQQRKYDPDLVLRKK